MLEKNEVKIAESRLSLKLHLLDGLTCLAPRYNVTLPPGSVWMSILLARKVPVGPQPLPSGFIPTTQHWNSGNLLVPRPGVPEAMFPWHFWWSQPVTMVSLTLVNTFFFESFCFCWGGKWSEFTEECCFSWNDLGDGLNSSLHLVSVDKNSWYSFWRSLRSPSLLSAFYLCGPDCVGTIDFPDGLLVAEPRGWCKGHVSCHLLPGTNNGVQLSLSCGRRW